MLEFTQKGFLLPSTNIPVKISDVKLNFVFNEIRGELFNNYQIYIDALIKLGITDFKVWLNGSFATKKENPNDIDLVVFINWKQIQLYESELKRFKKPNVLANFGVDAYIVKVFEEKHKNHFFTHSDTIHWLHDFSRTKKLYSGKRYNKGFLEIAY